MVCVVLFVCCGWIFENHTLKALNIPFKKSSFARKSQMWWHGRGKSGGSCLPEDKKANMWYGREKSGGSWAPAFPRSHTYSNMIKSKTSMTPIFGIELSLVSYRF